MSLCVILNTPSGVEPGEMWNEPVQRIEEQTESGQSEAAQSTFFQTESEPGPWRKDFFKASISTLFSFFGLFKPFHFLPCAFLSFLGSRREPMGLRA